MRKCALKESTSGSSHIVSLMMTAFTKNLVMQDVCSEKVYFLSVGGKKLRGVLGTHVCMLWQTFSGRNLQNVA